MRPQAHQRAWIPGDLVPVPNREIHDLRVGRLTHLARRKVLVPILRSLDVQVLDEGKSLRLPLRHVQVDLPWEEPLDVLEQLPLHLWRVGEVPLSGRAEHVAAAHEAAMRHVRPSGLVEEEKLAHLLELRHVALWHVFLDEPVLAAFAVRDQVLDGGRRTQVVLKRALQLRPEVPMLEHLVHDVCGERIQGSDGQAGLALGGYALLLAASTLLQEAPVLRTHLD
mmetsp:Transcript_77116/g.216388  ORF Transcript_77116/g.216388 Transcript_77116/m.216388 type:complete len:224 (+) Transcript_77116:244-915(+)